VFYSFELAFKMPIQIDATHHNDIFAVRILPTRNATNSVLSRYHIALLLDTSGSMEGAPLDAVIRTLHLLIDHMKDDDVLTLIKYSDVAEILTNGAIINTRSRVDIHRMVDRLKADASTNMEAAINALDSIVCTVPIHSVFLMTDGHVNMGLTNSLGLTSLLSNKLPNGIPVNTLGFGANHNADMLRNMAVNSRGSYTYADTTELLPAIIGDILGGLNDQVGQNAVLTATGGVCIEHGIDSAHPEIYRVGPLIADKPQWVLFRGVCGPVHLTWYEGVDQLVQVANVGAGVFDTMDIEEQIQRVAMIHTMTLVSDMLERSRYHEAIAELVRFTQQIVLSPALGRPFITRLQVQVEEMLDDISRRQHTGLNDATLHTRMASNITALTTQHGFFLSRETTTCDAAELTSPFSTPRQRTTTSVMTQRFTEPM
jgi:von Willebrand factor type A domain